MCIKAGKTSSQHDDGDYASYHQAISKCVRYSRTNVPIKKTPNKYTYGVLVANEAMHSRNKEKLLVRFSRLIWRKLMTIYKCRVGFSEKMEEIEL